VDSTSDVCFNHWDHGGSLKSCFNQSSQNLVQKSSLNKRRHVRDRYKPISTKFRHRSVHYGTEAKHLPSLWTYQHPHAPTTLHTHTHSHNTNHDAIASVPACTSPANRLHWRRHVWQQIFLVRLTAGEPFALPQVQVLSQKDALVQSFTGCS